MDCRVYNEYCPDAPNVTTHINQLPDNVQEWLRNKLHDALADYSLADIQSELQRAMDGRICDIEELVDPAEILDAWAIDQSFDPERVTVEEAAWIIESEDHKQALFEAHLTDDLDSPNGCAWYFTLYEYDDRNGGEQAVWKEVDGGLYWGYQNATDLISERPASPYVDGRIYGECLLAARETRIGYEYLDVLGIGDADPASCKRFVYYAEMKAVDWDLNGDLPRWPNLYEAINAGKEAGELEPKIVARAGDYDLCLETYDNWSVISLGYHESNLSEPKILRSYISGASIGDVQSGQQRIYELLWEKVNNYGPGEDGLPGFYGIDNPYDYSKPFANIEDARAAFEAHIRENTQLFPHPSQLEVSMEQQGSENLTVYSYGWDDENAPMQVQFTHSSVTDDYSWQASLYDGEKAVVAFKAGVNANFEDAYTSAAKELAANSSAAPKVQDPLHPGDSSKATNINALKASGELNPPRAPQAPAAVAKLEQAAIQAPKAVR